MRVFLAVFPPLAVREAVFAAAAPLRLTGAGVSWVKAENLHYTMRFLGVVGEDGARRAAEAAAEAPAVMPTQMTRARAGLGNPPKAPSSAGNAGSTAAASAAASAARRAPSSPTSPRKRMV